MDAPLIHLCVGWPSDPVVAEGQLSKVVIDADVLMTELVVE